MRKIKILLLISLVMAISLLLCSCPCYPSIFKWNITSVTGEITFINGNSARISRSHYRAETHPLAVHQGMTYLDIKWNNKVIFKPLDSDEELIGIYEVDYHTDYRTFFTITFENGEKTENGNAATHGLDPRDINPFRAYMTFEFRGMVYSFCVGYDEDTLTEKEYEEDYERFISNLRSEDNMLQKGNIELHSSGARIYADFLYNNREYDELYREGLILRVLQLTSDNQLIMLDELKEGKCMFVHYVYYDHDYSNTKMREGYVIYYIDPLQ